MSSYLISLDEKRPCRYVFEAKLWNMYAKNYGMPVNVLLDTGSFNTVIHESLVKSYGIYLSRTMKTSVGGFSGVAKLCILNKIMIGSLEIEKVAALYMIAFQYLATFG